eukprot:g3770.t1
MSDDAGPSDPYRTLGLPRGASQAEIKKAYRKLAFKHHPDVAEDGGDERLFNEVNEAYQLLSNRSSKAAIDRRGSGPERRGSGTYTVRQGQHGEGPGQRHRKVEFNTANPYQSASARNPLFASRAPNTEAAARSLFEQQLGAEKLAYVAKAQGTRSANRLAAKQNARFTRVNVLFCMLPLAAGFLVYKAKTDSKRRARAGSRR